MPPRQPSKKARRPPAEPEVSFEDDVEDFDSSPEELETDLIFERTLRQRRRALTVTSSGSHAPIPPVPNGTPSFVFTGSHPMGRPVLMDSCSPMAVINNLVCREVIDPSAPLAPLSATVLGLEATVRAMSDGTDISPFKAHIQRVAANQLEKSDVIRAYLNQIDHETIADLAVMRASSLRVIKAATARSDVNVGEALVIWRMVNEQLPELKKSLSDDKAVDGVSITEKIDYNRQQTERTVSLRWEGTTPQGRELIRKKLWTVKREMQAALGIKPPGIATEPEEEPIEMPPEETATPTPA